MTRASADPSARARPLPGEPAARGIPTVIPTPEGVPLAVRIAPAGDRASALILDLLFLTAGVFVFGLLGAVFGASGRSGWGLIVVTIGFFVLRTFYFTWFELRGRGRTPGKRRVGLRVIDATGGPLTAEAVVARNLTREVEIFLPLAAAIVPEQLGLEGPGWLRLLALAWVFLFAFFPLVNRRRMRVGDLIAGTLVVLEPKTTLLSDLGRSAPAEAAGAPAFAFTDAQLDVYGNYELQVLEDVLRRSRSSAADPATLDVVARKIRKKLRWEGEAKDSDAFLRAFYAALRGRLEHRLVLGRAKADKNAT